MSRTHPFLSRTHHNIQKKPMKYIDSILKQLLGKGIIFFEELFL